MQTIDQLIVDANSAISKYKYYKGCNRLTQGRNRLIIKKDLFVQVNQNVDASITNFALIQGIERIFGRDEYHGNWHRHPVDKPGFHNSSTDGRQAITLIEFLEEVDEVLRTKGLV